MTVSVPEPISGGLILSYRCSARCRHCMYACSKEWPADWISEEDAGRILQGLAGRIHAGPYGSGVLSLNHGLHFTGGEPFLNFPLLSRCVETARELDIPGLFAETNCFWATSENRAREMLASLKVRGLVGILISVNPFYLEYVPFERTERAIRVGREVFGANVMVYQQSYYEMFRTMKTTGTVAFESFLRMEGGGRFAENTEFFLSGRAPYSMEYLEAEGLELFPRSSAEAFLREPCRPDFLRRWHNHFDNYGNFVPGYCGGLSLGDSRELGRLLSEGIRLDERPVLRFIVEDDFRGLLGFAQERGYERNPEGYFSKCHLCADIRRHLVGVEDFPELRPREFYRRLTR